MLTIFEIAARPEKERSSMKLETSPWENIAIRVHTKMRAVYHHAAIRRSERQITRIVGHTLKQTMHVSQAVSEHTMWLKICGRLL